MIILRKEKIRSVLQYKHPWIFKNTIKRIAGNHVNGDLVEIRSEDNIAIGYGFYSPNSLIAVRMVRFGSGRPDDMWVDEKIKAAVKLRRQMHINSNGFRLINSEGDFFPGLIVDVYNSTAVIKVQIRGIERIIGSIVSAVKEYLPVKCVYLKRDEKAARVEKLELEGGYLSGTGDGRAIIEENGLSFIVDISRGQKTGFYLDQRENRFITEVISEKKNVLNLFSYTGGFALFASKGNASGVCSVENSSYAVELSEENEKLNRGKLKGTLEWKRGDVFEFLKSCGTFDIIVLDPPPFARKKQEVPGALRGYGTLHELAFARLKKEGFLLTFSCSGSITGKMFKDMLLRSALVSGRDVQLVSELHAAKDHPVSLFHPEGEYLKGWLVYVR